MRQIVLAITILGAVGAAGPALAGPGQCYDAYGRPVGPVYDTDHPNYAFLDAVIRRGGSCTGVQTAPSRPNYGYYGPGNGYDDGYNRRPRGYRSDDGSRRGYNRPTEPATPPTEPPTVFAPDRSR